MYLCHVPVLFGIPFGFMTAYSYLNVDSVIEYKLKYN